MQTQEIFISYCSLMVLLVPQIRFFVADDHRLVSVIMQILITVLV